MPLRGNARHKPPNRLSVLSKTAHRGFDCDRCTLRAGCPLNDGNEASPVENADPD